MKKITLLFAISLLIITNSFSQETVKYEQINSNTYKLTYYTNGDVKTKEQVYPLEKEENGSNYRSLDYYEEYNTEGVLIFKGNKISGRHLEFYTNGAKKVQGAVMNAKKEGRWAYTSEDGKMTKVEIYKAGELVNTIEY